MEIKDTIEQLNDQNAGKEETGTETVKKEAPKKKAKSKKPVLTENEKQIAKIKDTITALNKEIGEAAGKIDGFVQELAASKVLHEKDRDKLEVKINELDNQINSKARSIGNLEKRLKNRLAKLK